jgi:Ser/Thr protein kinase RdoA (MazF antagonist)
MEGVKAEDIPQSDWDFIVAAAKNLSFTPWSASVLRGGRINDTWRIETSEGPRVLRRYPQSRRPRQIQFELSLMTHLVRCGCKVPKPLTIDTAPVSAGARPHAWFAYIEGEPIPAQGGAAPAELAYLLQPVFLAMQGFSPPFSPVAETAVFRAQVTPFLSSLPPSDCQVIARIYENLSHWERGRDHPSGVVHADIHPGNILRDSSGELWLLDFDDAHVGTRALDWVMAAVEFSFVEEKLDKNLYDEHLGALRPTFVTALELESEPQLLRLVLLKCAINEHTWGTVDEKNRYLLELVRSVF